MTKMLSKTSESPNSEESHCKKVSPQLLSCCLPQKHVFLCFATPTAAVALGSPCVIRVAQLEIFLQIFFFVNFACCLGEGHCIEPCRPLEEIATRLNIHLHQPQWYM